MASLATARALVMAWAAAVSWSSLALAVCLLQCCLSLRRWRLWGVVVAGGDCFGDPTGSVTAHHADAFDVGFMTVVPTS